MTEESSRTAKLSARHLLMLPALLASCGRATTAIELEETCVR